jgi:speckle-type POZ protein
MVKCVVAVVKDPGIPPGAQVPPSDITEHLRNLLESKECTDVTFEVEGQDFPAHRLILAMRSPVSKAELRGLTTAKDTSRRIVVGDVRPPVLGISCTSSTLMPCLPWMIILT